MVQERREKVSSAVQPGEIRLAAEASPVSGARARARRGVSAWLVPDIALLTAAFSLFFCLFLFEAPWKLFRDSDTGWHIVTGERILATGELPRNDPYSFTRAGEPWFAWEWGADVIMGLAHRAGGPRGVALLYLTAIAACTWLWFRLHWAAGGDFLLACAMAAPLLSTVNLHWLARPHVLSWVLALAALWYAERVPARFAWRQALGIALATAIWANVHGSFFFAPAIAMAYAAHHSLRPLIWDLDRSTEWARARWFALAALASALGSLINPYGWQLHAHVARYLAGGELLARVGEFQSFNFHAEGSAQILVGLGLAAIGGVLALGQKNIAHCLLTAALLAMALRSARALPVSALLLLPLANGAITEALGGWRGLRPGLRRRLDAVLRYSANLRTLDRGFHGAALVPVLLLLAVVALRIPGLAKTVGFPQDQFPVLAAAHVERLPAAARLLAPDMYGGYLIYRFQGARKVFFDGRSDFYGIGFMKDYIKLVQVRPGWQEQMKRFGFTHALLPNEYSLLAALEQAGWRRMHRDKVATLLEGPSAN